METQARKPLHPVVWIAGIALIVFCGVGAAALMGWIGTGKAVEQSPITTLDKSRFEIYHTGSQILPDDEHFLFISYRRPPDATTYLHDLYVGSINGDPAVRIGDIPSRAEYANGRLFFVRDSTLMSAPFDLKSKKFTGDSIAVASNVIYFKATGTAAFGVSATRSLPLQSGVSPQMCRRLR